MPGVYKKKNCPYCGVEHRKRGPYCSKEHSNLDRDASVYDGVREFRASEEGQIVAANNLINQQLDELPLAGGLNKPGNGGFVQGGDLWFSAD